MLLSGFEIEIIVLKLFLGFINLAQKAPPFEYEENTTAEVLIEKELRKCDRRNALVEYSDKIQLDYEYYREYYPEKDNFRMDRHTKRNLHT